MVNQVCSAYGAPLILNLSGTYTSGIELWVEGDWKYNNAEDYYDDHSAGRLKFSLDTDNKLDCLESRYLHHELERAANCTTIRELCDILQDEKNLGWIWIDFELGSRLEPAYESLPGSWNPGEIWRGLLSPWHPWLILA